MHAIRLRSVNDFAEWRAAARTLLRSGIPPGEVTWSEPTAAGELFDEPAPFTPAAPDRPAGRAPRRFVALARSAICHRDPERFALLYRLLWRLQKDRTILANLSDVDTGKLRRRVEDVAREVERMRKDLHFYRSVSADGHHGIAAWFETKHYVLELVAPEFGRIHRDTDFRIATPYRTCWWDRKSLTFGPGGSPPARADRNLYATPAVALPEPPSGEPPMPLSLVKTEAEITSLARGRAEIEGCRRCPLYEHATQAVFGEGPAHADVMFVGEQPGDQEDLQGKPFVGPAGKVFDAAMDKVGFDRRRTYVTNAVKHFKFVPRGKRRLHQKPNGGEIAACRFWLNLEREFVKPRVIVALGATAVQAITGKVASIASLRGKPHELDDGATLFVTVHPSYLLRIRPGEGSDIEAEHRRFERDLFQIRKFAEGLATKSRRRSA